MAKSLLDSAHYYRIKEIVGGGKKKVVSVCPSPSQTSSPLDFADGLRWNQRMQMLLAYRRAKATAADAVMSCRMFHHPHTDTRAPSPPPLHFGTSSNESRGCWFRGDTATSGGDASTHGAVEHTERKTERVIRMPVRDTCPPH